MSSYYGLQSKWSTWTKHCSKSLWPQQTLDGIHVLADEHPSSAGGGSEETEAHRQGLPTVAWPDRRLMAVITVLRGRHRGVGHWCGACGGKAEGGQWPEMATRVEAVPGRRRRWQLDGRRWRLRSPRMEAKAKEMTAKGSRWRQHVRETKFCQVISGRKAGPQFIGPSINNGSTWNHCW
jgi:hypothetical protein